MIQPNALEFFHGKHRYNCAQAVLKAYAPVVGVDKACLNLFAKHGGGRAPGGECGALYAAKALLAEPGAKQAIEGQFAAAVGTTTCREIRTGRRASCEQCVQVASEAVYSQVQQQKSLLRPPECPR